MTQITANKLLPLVSDYLYSNTDDPFLASQLEKSKVLSKLGTKITPERVKNHFNQPKQPLRVADLRCMDSERTLKSTYRNKSGVYGLIHKHTGTVYVGRGTNLAVRPMMHFRKSGTNRNLKALIHKDGKESFYLCVLETVPVTDMFHYEKIWWTYFPSKILLNERIPLGKGLYKHSPEAIAKQKELAKNRPGRLHTQEQKDWLSAIHRSRGNPMFEKKITPEIKKKRVDNRKNRRWSAAQTEKQRERHSGFKNYHSVGLRFTNLRNPTIVVKKGSLTQAAKFLGYKDDKSLKRFQRLNPPVAHNKTKRRGDTPTKDQCWAIEYIPKPKKV